MTPRICLPPSRPTCISPWICAEKDQPPSLLTHSLFILLHLVPTAKRLEWEPNYHEKQLRLKTRTHSVMSQMPIQSSTCLSVTKTAKMIARIAAFDAAKERHFTANFRRSFFYASGSSLPYIISLILFWTSTTLATTSNKLCKWADI